MNWAAVTSLLTALTAVGALAFTGLSLNAARDQVAIAQSQNVVAEQGQFTDRYGRAVEQIGQQGAGNLQIRLGGVYALERLARDSPRDQPTIIEVLTAFVRTSTLRPTAARTPFTAAPCAEEPITADVQAAITVLGRRDPSRDQKAIIDLRKTCLVGAVFDEANLAEADFTGANLTNAEFFSANLDGAVFWAADLKEVQFHISDTRRGTTCRGTNFGYANIPAYGGGCHILNNATFFRANLRGGTFIWASAEGADFEYANLAHTNLSMGHYQDARFEGADLTGADFSGSDLRGANLRSTQHDHTNINGVRTDSNTIGKWW